MELEVITNDEFIKFLIQSIGGISGASTLVIVGIVVQVLMKFLSAPISGNLLGALNGNLKLLVVSGLSLVGGTVGLMSIEGLSFLSALVHSTTLNALLVFGHQIYKHFIEKK